MEPEREALRLSAYIALCVGVVILIVSVDSFNQKRLPLKVGEERCTWATATFKGCEQANRSLSQLTRQPEGLSFNL